MTSPNLIRSMRTLLLRWFSVCGLNCDCKELNVLGFINGVQEFDQNFVPVSAIGKLNATTPPQESPLRDFFHKDVAIIVKSVPRVVTNRSVLLKEWSNYSKVAQAVYLKDRLYYIGHGYLLDSKLKPLIMATYSVKEFKQKHLSRVLMHSPTLHIAPELLVDPYWKKFISECMIPTAVKNKVGLSAINFHIPKKYANVIQNTDVKVHDLSSFILSIKEPPLTMNISEELNTVTKDLTELPAVIY